MLAEPQRTALLGEAYLIHKLGADLGERTFVVVWIAVVEFVGKRELEHGVADVFEPLVVVAAGPSFVRDGRMGERQQQECRVAERVAEAGLQGVETRHGRVDES